MTDRRPEEPDVRLPSGRMTGGIVRRGGLVRRPTGPWSAAVHEYLRHLESARFRGSPRLTGTEGDLEILTYLEGDVAADPDWEPGRGNRLPPFARTDDALSSVARLLRELHETSKGFRPSSTGYRFHPHPPGPGEVVSHGDLGPWNTVYRDGIAIGFIDWDSCRPIDPITDLAGAAWAFVPLAPPGRIREAGFDPVPELPGRLRTFVDAYGLRDRSLVLPALQRSQLLSAELVKYWPVDPAGAAASLRHHAADLEWLQSVTVELGRAL